MTLSGQTWVLPLKLCCPPELLSAMWIPHLRHAGTTIVGMRDVWGLFPGWILLFCVHKWGKKQ